MRAFIDERAEEIGECLNLPVYTIEQFRSIFPKDTVIFVAVKNVYYHMDIVKNLNRAGFEKIIYKSEHMIKGTANVEEHILDKVYESMVKKGGVPDFPIPVIPYQKELIWNTVEILDQDEEFVTVKMPAELLYTGETDSEWTDVPVLSLVPYISMFRFFGGDVRYSPDDYVLLCQKGARSENLRITEGWKRYVIKNRKDIYENMRWKYEFTPEYFIQHAPEVNLNSRGTFTLRTGKHRVSFMLASGAVSIPVKIKSGVWEKYSQSVQVQELKKLLEQNQELSIPIPHPCFQGNMAYNYIFQQMILQKILKMMYEVNLIAGNYRCIDGVIDLTDNYGYFAHFFSGMGMKVYAKKENPETDTMLDKLFRVEMSDMKEILNARSIILAEKMPANAEFDVKQTKGIFILHSGNIQYTGF